MTVLDSFLRALARAPAVLVTVVQTEGSVPRQAGAWMAVFDAEACNTIGGGHLEYQALQRARQALRGGHCDPAPQRVPLGPSLGQCCGGVVFLRYERVDAGQLDALRQRLTPAQRPVALFGAGHVGQALVAVLARLPVTLTWVDSREGVFPDAVPAQVVCEHSEPVQDAVHTLEPGSCVLIMSFSHAEDLDVVTACLQRLRERDDLPFVGLIGSRTKWATFARRLRDRGFCAAEMARVTCPMGVPGILGKEPEVIAVAVAAQLLLLPGGTPPGRD